MIAALPGVVDDSVGSFPCRAKLSLGRVSSHCGDLAQDKVTYVKSSKLYPLAGILSFCWKLFLLLRLDNPV